jgi:hypothetical protein
VENRNRYLFSEEFAASSRPATGTLTIFNLLMPTFKRSMGALNRAQWKIEMPIYFLSKTSSFQAA